MPQFAGHWYSGRAARLVFVEAALVVLALWIGGQHARGAQLAALVAAAACIPAALYLADLYDPQVMRNDRTRGGGVLKALGFAALAAAILGLMARGGLPRGALVDLVGVASVGILLARAALVARIDERGHNRVLIIGAGQRAGEIERISRTEAFGEYEVGGKLDPAADLSLPGSEQQKVAINAGASPQMIAAPTLMAVEDAPPAEVSMAPVAEVVPSSQLVVGPAGAPAQISGPHAEAAVAALPTAPRMGPPNEGPLASVVQLPTTPHTVVVTAHTMLEAAREL